MLQGGADSLAILEGPQEDLLLWAISEASIGLINNFILFLFFFKHLHDKTQEKHSEANYASLIIILLLINLFLV